MASLCSLSVAVLLATCLATCLGCEHRQASLPRLLMIHEQQDQFMMPGQQQVMVMMHNAASGAVQPAFNGAHTPMHAATGTSPTPDDPIKQCATLHFKEQCTPKHCIWCQNKWSPMPGSDGVCIGEDYAKELPSWTYDCKHIRPPLEHQGQAAAAAA